MRLLKCLSILIVVHSAFSAFAAITPTSPANQAAVSFQLFYDELSPHGTWISHPVHGYVWLPMDDPDTFFPYGSRGHWVYSNYGWTWVSYYKWGWIPFHYGRWDYDPSYGWYWVPGTDWGPAWVIWRHAPGHFGWAPIRPGITITIIIGGHYDPPIPWWIFCEHRHFGRKRIYDYYVPRKHYRRILGESRGIFDTREEKEGPVYLKGPSADLIRKETGREVDVVKIVDRQAPGEEPGNGTLSIYRPKVEQSTAAETRPAPKQIGDIKTSRVVSPSPALPAIEAPRREESTVQPPSSTKAPKVVSKPEKQENVRSIPPPTPPPATKAPTQIKRPDPPVVPPQTKSAPNVSTTPSTSTTPQGTTPKPEKKDDDDRSTKPVKKN